MARNRFDRTEKKKERVVKEKFLEDIEKKIPPLRPMNAKQAAYIEAIKAKDLIIATGYSGTSKTFIPTVMACDALRLGVTNGGIDKIVLSRPNVSNSKSLGYMKGDLIEKFSYWLAPVLTTMKERLGQAALELHIEKGNIEFLPLEVIKGYDARDCFMIVDEAEDISWDEAKKIVTRQGRNSTLVLAGDLLQSELKSGSGLRKLIELAKKYTRLDVGLIDFDDVEDIVRSKQVKEWIKVFGKENL